MFSGKYHDLFAFPHKLVKKHWDGRASSANFHRILKFGVAVAVDHGVDLGMLLAVGAFVRRKILIIRNILQREQGVDRNSVAFFHGAEQGADSSELPVVILDAFHSRPMVFPVVTDATIKSTRLFQIIGWMLSRKIIWLLALVSGVTTARLAS